VSCTKKNLAQQQKSDPFENTYLSSFYVPRAKVKCYEILYIHRYMCLFVYKKSQLFFVVENDFRETARAHAQALRAIFGLEGGAFWLPELGMLGKSRKPFQRIKKIKSSFTNTYICLLRMCKFLLNNKIIGKVYKKDKNPVQIKQQKRNPFFIYVFFLFRVHHI
jgi:hypothetical protein